MSRKKGLGRGLDALLGSSRKSEPRLDHDEEVAVAPDTDTASNAVRKPYADGDLTELPVDLIQRGKYQPRINMHPESLEELADSIRQQGVVQPIVVRPVGGDRYEIIAGERRWRAAQIAGLHQIPCVVRRVDDRAAIAMALIENIQRENLNPMEESRALQRLIEEFKMTHQQAAEAVGRSRTGVTNLLRLLELDERVAKMLEDSKLEMGHARSLLSVKGNDQYQAAMDVVARGLSVRDTEQLVRKLNTPNLDDEPKKEKQSSHGVDPDIKRLQEEISEKLGAEIQILHSVSGHGKMIIKYNSSDELDGILARIH